MNWDEFFLTLAHTAKRKSKDQSTQVGCVFVSPENDILTLGWNGFPRGVNDHTPEFHERPLKYKITEHAERNAAFNAARLGLSLKGSRIYVTHMPCTDCARAIIQVGCKEVVYDGAACDKEFQKRWREDWLWAHEMFKQANVNVREVRLECAT